LANIANRAIIGYVNAFFSTIEPDSYEWNSDRVMIFRALVYRAEMVVWTESFECGDKRSCLCCQIHKASFSLPKTLRLRTALNSSRSMAGNDMTTNFSRWVGRASRNSTALSFLLQSLFFFATSLQRKLERRAETVIRHGPQQPP
jgi:hypothetical protein